MAHMRPALRVVLQLAVSAALIAVLVWRGDVADLVHALRTAGWLWLALATGPAAAASIAHGVRWWLLVRRVGAVPLWDAELILFAASGVGAVVPLRAGAAVQIEVLHRRYGMERAAVAGTLVAEGMLDGVALLLLAPPAFWLLPAGRERVSLVWVAAGVAVIVAILAVLLGGRRIGLKWTALLPVWARGRVERLLADLTRGFAALGQPRAVLLLVLVTCSTWICAALGYGVVGRAFGIRVPAEAYLAAAILANLSGVVPLTQSNIGPYELVVRETLAAFGADGNHAAALAVAAHAASITATVLAGRVAGWLLHLGRDGAVYAHAGPAIDAGRQTDAAPHVSEHDGRRDRGGGR